ENVQGRDDLIVFGIRLRETDRLIGTCQLLHINRVHRTAELQIRIGDAAERGRGYGTEAVALLVGFAFKDLNLHRVSLQVFATNARAIHAYEKAGFVREGVLRQAAHVDGGYVDLVVMGILREEHDAG
ncbi:MAG TPA: GNAT family protein, partial [Vicinamibacteria bacterium]|nr:GNAT family protein [Vicinamibacteria bacterium]